MAKQNFYAAKAIEVEGGKKYKAGDVVAVLETELPLQAFVSGTSNGALTLDAPKVDAKPEPAKPEATKPAKA